jgi:hypothetical protein
MIGLVLVSLGWLLAGDWRHWGALYLLCAAQVLWAGRRVGTFRWYTALFYPAPLFFFFVLFARSAMQSGRTVSWKGRKIDAD